MTELDDILDGVRTIKVAGQDVVIDPRRLTFSEVTLTRYTEEEGVWYNYFGQRLADADAEWQVFSSKHDKISSEKFVQFKSEGGSDKFVEARVKSDDEVKKAKDHEMAARHKVKVLQQHLRAWDKCHENAQSRGHMLRKEIDKLNRDTFAKNKMDGEMEEEVDKIIASSKDD
jgi:hypothetical protein